MSKQPKDTRTKEQIERANRKMDDGLYDIKPTKNKPATVEDSQKDNLKK
jgi:hypothetical protein